MSRSEEFAAGHGGGDEPDGVQPHHELVRDALHQWKGAPGNMRRNMDDEQVGAPQPDSALGRGNRARAAALLRELRENARPNDRPLYRGSHLEPGPVESWSESPSVAQGWARRGDGKLYVLRKGAGNGLRVADHVVPHADMREREWLVNKPEAYEVRDVAPRKTRKKT